MLRKILFVTAAAIAVMMIAAPALAFDGCGIGGCGIGYGGCGIGGYGLGYGGYGCGAAASAVSYGAPEDCVATISCNIPATQMVPYMTTTTQMQTYTYPVTVPQQSVVTVPKAVIVPEQVPVTTYRTECAQGVCPVQVPATAYAPVTYKIPQTYTVCMGGMGQMAPGSGMPYGQEQFQQMPPQQMPMEQFQQMPPQQMPQQLQQMPQQQ